MDGILIVDKPAGYTSFDVVAVIRKLSGEKKVGHTGTLDPMATGVLPVLVGKATRSIPFLDDTDKEYLADFRIGVSTDTMDATGKVLENSDQRVTREDIETVLPQFRGEIEQMPPMYSAVQVDGKRLYSLARKGIEVERPKRKINVHQCDLLDFNEETQEGRLQIICSKGTYVRTLCSDIGQAMGTLAILTDLRRTVACGFSLQSAVSLDRVREHVEQGGSVSDFLLPTEAVFSEFPTVTVTDAQKVRFCNGGALSLDRLPIPKDRQIDGQGFRVLSRSDAFLGLGQINLKKGELIILRLFNGEEAT